MQRLFVGFTTGFRTCLKNGVVLLLLPPALILLSCSSPSSRDRIDAIRDSSHAHSAAVGMDSFWMDNRSPPDRPVEHFEFYYKHCIEDEFRPYPDHLAFVCTGPY